MGVAFGGTERGMAQKFLDKADVGAPFKEVGGESMAKAVNGNGLLYPGFLVGLLKDALGRTDGKV
jgi:hypothetical protein